MYEGTIDWDAYWRTDRETETDFPANVGAYGKADLLARFFEDEGVPDDFASIGCGPADCPLELAERFPELDVFGYDAAESVVRENRERIDGETTDRGNVTFEVATLPDFDVGRQFDLVYCYATLHYVRNVERAIRNLYEHVRPGGHLVFNYPSETTREFYHDQFDDEEEFRDRFQLVFEGENVTSAAEIEDALGASLHDYWDAVDADSDVGAAPPNPCVYVEK
ncbi:class I SAM-dependent methyltransferase [Halorussus salinisoli]|uniref:class I SAM-dependent methyltransferase n=1 Tax=Halorussus salinisoli TaxID=2558242 RepID=UPI0010C184E0|nr:class I SAM-dependent methyltransferase [Halorussus salinisoli]